jgi:transcriptional regulator with XRE-family HTH domain
MGTLINRIESACKEKGISLSALAEKIGKSRAAATRWRRGGGIDGDTAADIAKALNVTSDWLLTGKESRLKPLSVPTVTNYDDIDIPHLDVQVDLAITDETRTALAKLISSYKNAGDAKKASMQMLVALPEHEMSTMLLLLKSLSDKYKDAP